MLEIKDLHAQVGDVHILQGLSLTVKPGEVHVIMGPNGAGKSTLSRVVCGDEDYEVTQGVMDFEVNFRKKNLLEMEADERSREGIFMAFQYPVEIPGVPNQEFLRSAFNSVCAHQGVPEMDPLEFEDYIQGRIKEFGIKQEFLSRDVNVDFSGGEKKRNEVLQMAILNPRLCFLDETDSGLDIDSLKVVFDGVSKLRNEDNAFVIVTHYPNVLEMVKPDKVHVLVNGRIVKSGGMELAKTIEERGYEDFH